MVDAKLDLLGPHDDSKQGLAELAANYKLWWTRTDTLAVENSSFVLKAKLDRAPIIRWDYDRDARTKSRSHVQVTAHRGALSHIPCRLEHKTPHSIESLHIPMVARGLRPCLEDVIEFLIRDCGFQGSLGWESVIHDGRARWRRIPTRAVVRDAPAEAVAELQSLGYQVFASGGRARGTDGPSDDVVVDGRRVGLTANVGGVMPGS